MREFFLKRRMNQDEAPSHGGFLALFVVAGLPTVPRGFLAQGN
jgi:hypothetical protein